MRSPRTTVGVTQMRSAVMTATLLIGAAQSSAQAQALAPDRFRQEAAPMLQTSPDADGTSLADLTPAQPSDRPLTDIQALKAGSDEAPKSEIGLAFSGASVTNDYGDWYGVHIRGLHRDGSSTFLGEISELRRFGEHTTFGSINYIEDFNADWFGAAGFSGTTQGTILPSARVDLSINRKVLPDRSLLFSLGAGYAWNRSGHRTQLYHAGLVWYVVPKWILEAGWNYSVDSPGSVKAPAYYAAVTYGEVGKSVIALRGGYGREAYQATGSGNELVDFKSKEASLRWRYWITRQWSAQVEIDYYHNPFYDRRGAEISALYQW